MCEVIKRIVAEVGNVVTVPAHETTGADGRGGVSILKFDNSLGEIRCLDAIYSPNDFNSATQIKTPSESL